MYDVIVIGSDLSSFIAALLSARYGRKTLLIDECGLGDCLSFSDFTFNIDPLPWSGFGSGQMFTKLLSELNIPLPDPAKISPLNPAFQAVLPEHRIDFFIDREALVHDISREYPEEGKQIQNLYQSITKVCDTLEKAIRVFLESEDPSMKERMQNWLDLPFTAGDIWRLSQKLRGLEKLPSLGLLFDSELTLFSNQHVNHDKPLSSAYLLSLPWRGLYYLFGGKHLLIGQLRKRYEELRGESLAGCSITSIRAGTKIEVDIKPKGKPISVVGQELVISAKSPALPGLLDGDKKFSKLTRRFRRVESVQYPFTLHLGVDNRGLPDRMSEYVILVSDDQAGGSMETGPFLFLESSVADDTGLAPRGKRTLTATAFLARSPRDLDDGELKSIGERMLKTLEHFLPFLRESLAFMDMERSIEVSRQYQHIVNPRYRFSGHWLPGLATLPIKTPLRNVLITGGITFAGLGFEGEVLSGMKAGYLVAGSAEI
jgi:phytoene dehydrogenase-like protein